MTTAKTMLVVGAGDSLGSAIARTFAADEFTVCVSRRNGDKLKPLVDEIERLGGKAIVFGSDARREDGKLKRYSDVIYEAMWAEPKNLGDPKVVAQVLAEGGFDPRQIFTAIEQVEVKEKLRRNTDEALSRGVFGAPAMFVHGELFFGQDRLHFVEEGLV
jgi:2-hydroxychromene-2-carboxylate isomerase